MAKYEATYSCGHSGEVVLYGPVKERESKLAWYKENGLCPECYKARQAAKAQEKVAGLVVLTGSEKQVKWANDLRVKALDEINARIARVNDADRAKLVEILNVVLNTIPEAKWWIDNRDNLVRAISPLWEAKVREAGMLK